MCEWAVRSAMVLVNAKAVATVVVVVVDDVVLLMMVVLKAVGGDADISNGRRSWRDD